MIEMPQKATDRAKELLTTGQLRLILEYYYWRYEVSHAVSMGKDQARKRLVQAQGNCCTPSAYVLLPRDGIPRFCQLPGCTAYANLPVDALLSEHPVGSR